MPYNFSKSAKYYDIIQDTAYFNKSAKFVSKILKKFKVKNILELGCGTGLYLGPLSKNFKIDGLDIGKDVLDVARKKCKVKLHKKDMTNFQIKKKFDAILCMNTSLLYLPNYQKIEKTIKNVNRHLTPNGFFLLDLPNLDVEIKELNNSQLTDHYKLPNGHMHVIFRNYKKKKKWISEWVGFVQEGKNFSQFHEYYEELVYSPKKIEKILKQNGFKILQIFGSRLGGKFNKNSDRRFYLCQK